MPEPSIATPDGSTYAVLPYPLGERTAPVLESSVKSGAGDSFATHTLPEPSIAIAFGQPKEPPVKLAGPERVAPELESSVTQFWY